MLRVYKIFSLLFFFFNNIYGCDLLHTLNDNGKVFMCDASKTRPSDCHVFWDNTYISFCVVENELKSNTTINLTNFTNLLNNNTINSMFSLPDNTTNFTEMSTTTQQKPVTQVHTPISTTQETLVSTTHSSVLSTTRTPLLTTTRTRTRTTPIYMSTTTFIPITSSLSSTTKKPNTTTKQAVSTHYTSVYNNNITKNVETSVNNTNNDSFIVFIVILMSSLFTLICGISFYNNRIKNKKHTTQVIIDKDDIEANNTKKDDIEANNTKKDKPKRRIKRAFTSPHKNAVIPFSSINTCKLKPISKIKQKKIAPPVHRHLKPLSNSQYKLPPLKKVPDRIVLRNVEYTHNSKKNSKIIYKNDKDDNTFIAKKNTEILQQCQDLLDNLPKNVIQDDLLKQSDSPNNIEEDLPLPSSSPPPLPPRPKHFNSSWKTTKDKPCLRKSLKKINNLEKVIHFTPNKVDNNVPSMNVSILNDGSIV